MCFEEPRILVSGVRSDRGEPQEVGSVRSGDVSPGILSSLITQLIRAAQEDNLAEVKVPPDAGTWGPPVAPVPGSPVLGAEPVMVCFSCGEPMLPGEHFISVFATGLVGYYPGWPISGGMA